jgi:hypothetical protein
MAVRVFAFLMAFLMAASVAQARMRSVPLLVPDRVVMKAMDGQAPSVAQVRKAILMGTQPFGWVLEQDQPSAMQFSHTKQGKHSAVVRFEYDASGYQLSYVSSVGLYHEQAADGTVTIHPTYNMWVRNLLVRAMIPGELVPASAIKP